ncbi:HAAS signaling domain-containing protein [Streptomyces sp. NPDC051310]|uniref:HAAS signaling domain-containing protein n=1 Tax=Streptomyces sp. NPDC051310 TaxID=3365649 RepID=UPI00379C7A8E
MSTPSTPKASSTPNASGTAHPSSTAGTSGASGAGTLTDRYVDEVVRHIPAGQRDDVADELRTTIADTVEARGPADREAAERAVLTGLGDPIRLAARYADRPLTLIGPALYPAYVRLLVLLLSTALPVVTAVTVGLDVLDGKGLGEVIGKGVGTVLTVGAQMIAWLTVVFAVAERTGKRVGAVGREWTPDDLPERRAPGRHRTEACAGVAWHALLLALVVWQHTAKPYRTAGGERLEVLDPGLWSGWIWPVLAGLAGLVVLGVIRATHPWTLRLAVWGAAVEALFALPLAWILYRQEFFNPALLAAVNGSWRAPDAFYTVAALGVLAVSIGETAKHFRGARGRA